jgi:hypothetical protein
VIKASDFEIETGTDAGGTFVRVRHTPTGAERAAVGVDDVGQAGKTLVDELTGLLYDPNDIVTETIRLRPYPVVRITHLPSGISRTADHMGSNVVEALLDEVLGELWAGKTLPDA